MGFIDVKHIRREIANVFEDGLTAAKTVVKASSGAKDIAKVGVGIITLFAISNAAAKEAGLGAITVINAIELPSSIYDVVEVFQKGNLRKNWVKVAKKLDALVVSSLSTLGALSRLDILKIATLSSLVGKLPLVGNFLVNHVPFDALINGFCVPMYTLGIIENGSELHKNLKVYAYISEKKDEHNKNKVSIKTVEELHAKIDKYNPKYVDFNNVKAEKLEKWKLRLEDSNVKKWKNILALSVDSAKLVVAVVALVAIFALGGIPAVAIGLIALGLIANLLSLGKQVGNGYLEAEHVRHIREHSFRPHVAAAA